MSKWVFLSKEDKVISCLMNGNRLVECRLDDRRPSFVGSIFVARVENLLPSICAAFLRIGEQRLYLPLKRKKDQAGWELSGLIFTKQAHTDRITAGDELVVQVEKDAVKTKEPVARGSLQIGGRYGVVMYPESGIHFSRKIVDNDRRLELRQAIAKECGYGVLVRTNAAEASTEEVLCEFVSLRKTLEAVLDTASFRSAGSVLWQPDAAYLKTVQSIRPVRSGKDSTEKKTKGDEIEELVTDDKTLFYELSTAVKQYYETAFIPCRFYQGAQLSLDKCFRITHLMEKALEKQVWLSSGAYLVIEQTEALTAIDVNSGKADGKKLEMEEFVLGINLEAARESMAQIRLRNLSGIIILDFINMREKSGEEELLTCLKHLAALDPVKTEIIDMTPLGLVEVTRKKERDTLERQYRDFQNVF